MNLFFSLPDYREILVMAPDWCPSTPKFPHWVTVTQLTRLFWVVATGTFEME